MDQSNQPVPDCSRCRELEARLLELEARLRDLEDKLKPPPKRPLDPPPPAPAKTPTGKRRGAQPGHPPHLKKWLPRERVTDFVVHAPRCCAKCNRALHAEAGPLDPPPTIHQVAELPPLRAAITQHEGHSRTRALASADTSLMLPYPPMSELTASARTSLRPSSISPVPTA